jgi:uncharacterized membrane protein YfcA
MASSARRATALALWFGGTFVGTICGIGGGLFATPILHYVLGEPFRAAIGSSLVLVLTMTLVATGFEALHADSALDWAVVGLLVLGSVPGTHVGHAFSKRVSVRTLKVLFAVFLLASAARALMLDTDAPHLAVLGGVRLDAARIAWITAVGFGGGFLAPLLGIGGGILVIPALFLTLSDLSYLEVRACSMAMGLVNSAQAVYLSARDSGVRSASTPSFAAVAVVGALCGVWAVHQPGWDEVARHAMTTVIVFVAARFAWDAWSTRGAPAH